MLLNRKHVEINGIGHMSSSSIRLREKEIERERERERERENIWQKIDHNE